MPALATRNQCTGCLACVDACNHSALIKELGEDGHIYVRVIDSLCVGCGLCEKTCPVTSELNYSSSPLAKAYAGWAKNKSIRKTSATAGAFSALAQFILGERGIVCGAAIVDGLQVRHICIDRIEDLHLLQGSKYAQSDASGIYQTAFHHLKEGRTVLFSGTGCQVAGLYGYLSTKKYEGTLYTIDLICGGVPSRLLIDKFVEHEPYTVKRIVSFRNKDHSWNPKGNKYNLKVEDIQGTLHDYTDKRNLITTGFACEMTNRYSCYQCQFAGEKRMSDITIGDYWGVKDYLDQHSDGVSAIIVHNEKAEQLLSDAKVCLEYHETDLANIVSNNKRLVKMIDKRYLLPERKYLAFLFNKLNYKTLCKIYALDFNKTSPWILYKAYRVFANKLLK